MTMLLFVFFLLFLILFSLILSTVKGIKDLIVDENAPIAVMLGIKRSNTERKYYYKYEAPQEDGKWHRRFQLVQTVFLCAMFLLWLIFLARMPLTKNPVAYPRSSHHFYQEAFTLQALTFFFSALLLLLPFIFFALAIPMATGMLHIPSFAVYIRRGQKDIYIREGFTMQHTLRLTFPLSRVKNAALALHNSKDIRILHQGGFYRWVIWNPRGPFRGDVFNGLSLEFSSGRRAFIVFSDAENFIVTLKEAQQENELLSVP